MQVYSLIGFVLSLLLVFRTNTAYDRWWEGRKKWGELVNNSRNLAIKISALTDDPEIRTYFKRMISNYVFAMKEHLREGVKIEELDLTEEEKKELSQFEHKPNYIAQKMYAKLHAMKQSGKLTEENYIVVDVNLKTFSDIIGACERIKNTPIPYSYSMFFEKVHIHIRDNTTIGLCEYFRLLLLVSIHLCVLRIGKHGNFGRRNRRSIWQR